MILYNLNPGDNSVFAAMAGNFQDGSIPGKIQFGSGWWFLDQKEGIEWQLNALSTLALLSPVLYGMFERIPAPSCHFPRHELFPPCSLQSLGSCDIESGELPDREDLVGPMIENICYHNAARFLGLALA